MNLYDFPELYDALLFVENEYFECINQIIRLHLNGPLKTLFDPACGPGGWLRLFAERDVYVAGSDIETKMIAYAKGCMRNHRCELRVGNMKALEFMFNGFDVAVNLDASVGHLQDADAVYMHLCSVREHLRKDGIYLMSAIINDQDEYEDRRLLGVTGPLPVSGGGFASVRFFADYLLFKDRQVKGIRYEVSTTNVPSCPEHFTGGYELLTFSVSVMRHLVCNAGLVIDEAYVMSSTWKPEAVDLDRLTSSRNIIFVLRS